MLRFNRLPGDVLHCVSLRSGNKRLHRKILLSLSRVLAVALNSLFLLLAAFLYAR